MDTHSRGRAHAFRNDEKQMDHQVPPAHQTACTRPTRSRTLQNTTKRPKPRPSAHTRRMNLGENFTNAVTILPLRVIRLKPPDI